MDGPLPDTVMYTFSLGSPFLGSAIRKFLGSFLRTSSPSERHRSGDQAREETAPNILRMWQRSENGEKPQCVMASILRYCATSCIPRRSGHSRGLKESHSAPRSTVNPPDSYLNPTLTRRESHKEGADLAESVQELR